MLWPEVLFYKARPEKFIAYQIGRQFLKWVMGSPFYPRKIEPDTQSNLTLPGNREKIKASPVMRDSHAGPDEVEGFSGGLFRTGAHDDREESPQWAPRKNQLYSGEAFLQTDAALSLHHPGKGLHQRAHHISEALQRTWPFGSRASSFTPFHNGTHRNGRLQCVSNIAAIIKIEGCRTGQILREIGIYRPEK